MNEQCTIWEGPILWCLNAKQTAPVLQPPVALWELTWSRLWSYIITSTCRGQLYMMHAVGHVTYLNLMKTCITRCKAAWLRTCSMCTENMCLFNAALCLWTAQGRSNHSWGHLCRFKIWLGHSCTFPYGLGRNRSAALRAAHMSASTCLI